jgi:hypothetical protein
MRLYRPDDDASPYAGAHIEVPLSNGRAAPRGGGRGFRTERQRVLSMLDGEMRRAFAGSPPAARSCR